jgi:hypothetical protein
VLLANHLSDLIGFRRRSSGEKRPRNAARTQLVPKRLLVVRSDISDTVLHNALDRVTRVTRFQQRRVLLSKPFGRERPDALFVPTSPFFNGRRVQLAQLAAFHHLPATYALRDYTEVGGLVQHSRGVSSGWQLCRARPQRGEARRFANRASEQVRIGNQYADRAHARYCRAVVPDRDCRRADRVGEFAPVNLVRSWQILLRLVECATQADLARTYGVNLARYPRKA